MLQDVFTAQSYLRYQGDKFVKRFDANCYLRIADMLDAHDVSLGRGDFHEVLASIQQPTLLLSMSLHLRQGDAGSGCPHRLTWMLQCSVVRVRVRAPALLLQASNQTTCSLHVSWMS